METTTGSWRCKLWSCIFTQMRKKECKKNSSPEELLVGEYNVPLRVFSSDELIKATKNFHRRNIITEDAFYSLYRGSFQKRQIMVKKFGKESSFWPDEEITLYATQDMAITSQVCNHRNVLKLIGCCLESQFPILVYECETSIIQTLSNRLYEEKRSGHDNNSTLAWKTRLSIANDIASALVHLHTAFSTPIVHKNLKPGNIIIDQSGVAKLMDFSFAIQIPPGESQVEEDRVVGTCGFLEAEYLTTGIVTEKTDVYAFGVIMLQLLTGKRTAVLLANGGGGSHLDSLGKIYAEEDGLKEVVDARMIWGDGVGVDEEQQFGAFVELAVTDLFP